MTERTYAFDGVPELIAQLQAASMPWGVVTNKSMRFTDPLTQQMPLFASAGAIVSGDTTPHAKPHPAPLLEAAARIGLPPQCFVYVGDDERDIVAGKADRKSTRLNSSHLVISYAVFCLKKKNRQPTLRIFSFSTRKST